MAEHAELLLPARLDAATATWLYRHWAPRANALEVIDFSAVLQIDSAGVALIRALIALACQSGAPAPQLRSPPPRYFEFCRAHRLNDVPTHSESGRPTRSASDVSEFRDNGLLTPKSNQ